MWHPLIEWPEHLPIDNPAVTLDRAKRETIAARSCEVPAAAVEAIGRQSEGTR